MKRMATVDKDLQKKREFEERLATVLIPVFQKYINGFRESIFYNGPIPGTRDFRPDFRFSLDRHYRLVQEEFRSRVFSGLDPVEMNRMAREYFEERMAEWRRISADDISGIVAETNVSQAERSLELAEDTLTEIGSFSKLELSLTAAAILKRLFDVRRVTIGQTETQAAAESTKVFKGEAVANSSLKETYVVIKTWNSLLDGRERPTHGAASGQERPEGQPFTVGGSVLYYPGDVRAPARERINCRCFLTSEITRIG